MADNDSKINKTVDGTESEGSEGSDSEKQADELVCGKCNELMECEQWTCAKCRKPFHYNGKCGYKYSSYKSMKRELREKWKCANCRERVGPGRPARNEVGKAVTKPNKQPEMECRQCRETFDNEEGISCSKCKHLFHHKCSISKSKWEAKSEEHKNTWKCNICNDVISGAAGPLPCGTCNDRIDGESPKCSKCNNVFHFGNCSIRKSFWKDLSSEAKLEWECIACQEEEIEEEENIDKNTEAQGVDLNFNIAAIVQKAVENAFKTVNLGELSSKIDTVLDRMGKSEKMTEEIQSEVTLLKTKQDELEQKMNGIIEKQSELDERYINEKKQLEEKVEKIEKKINKGIPNTAGNSKEFENLQGHVKDLTQRLLWNEDEARKAEDKFHELEQYHRNRNIEIQNLPEIKSENLAEIVVKIAEKLGAEIKKEDIDIVHRIPVNNGISPIIVQFKNRTVRDKVLEMRKTQEKKPDGKQIKKKKEITQDDIIRNGKKDQIYIKENQSPYYRNLEIKTKKIAVIHNNWKFVWFEKGKLLARENENSKIHRIVNERDLSSLFGEEQVRKITEELNKKAKSRRGQQKGE